MEITKQQLIDMWLSYCDARATDPEVFSNYASFYSLRINDKISISVEKSENKINLFFNDVIRYKNFELDQVECDGLLLSWELGMNKASKYQKEKAISECLHEFERLISFNVNS